MKNANIKIQIIIYIYILRIFPNSVPCVLKSHILKHFIREEMLDFFFELQQQ